MTPKTIDPKRLQDIERQLAEYKGDDMVISFEEMLVIAEEDYRRVPSFKSSLPTLDKILGGFEAGELVVVSGITGQGKTTFCQTLTHNFWKNDNETSLWFSYEVQPYHFLKKFPELPESFMPKSMAGNSIQWLQKRMLESKLKHENRVVFIDHLHFLIDMAEIKNPSLDIGRIVRDLKKLAVRHNFLIFLIAHTTKAKFGKKDDEPGLGSVRDSSLIEQEADTVLYVWRNTDKNAPENMSKLKIAKNRKRGIVDKKIDLKYDNQLLLELSKDEYEEPPAQEEQVIQALYD